jgi:hypothetical protein
MSSKYSFFQHRECEFFPCHQDNNQNCLFCYCPLFNTEECVKLDVNNINKCCYCKFPHIKNNYNKIIKKLKVLYGKSVKNNKS